MFYIKRKRRVLVTVLVLIAVISGGYMLGLYIGNKQLVDSPDGDGKDLGYQTMQAEKTDESHMDGRIRDPVVVTTSNTLLIFKRHYKSCEETVAEERKAIGNEIGLDREGLSTEFPNWVVEVFSPYRIVLRTDIDGYCPNHFIIKERGGMVVIYTPSSTGEYDELFEETEIPTYILPVEIQDEIRKGLVIDSLEELEHFMEDFES